MILFVRGCEGSSWQPAGWWVGVSQWWMGWLLLAKQQLLTNSSRWVHIRCTIYIRWIIVFLITLIIIRCDYDDDTFQSQCVVYECEKYNVCVTSTPSLSPSFPISSTVCSLFSRHIAACLFCQITVIVYTELILHCVPKKTLTFLFFK